MRIENTNSLAGLRGTKKASKSSNSSASFSLGDEAEEAAETNTTAPATNVTHLDALLALQGVDDEEAGKKRTVEQGYDLLDRLEEMQLGLLTGRLSATQVTRISQKITNLGRTGDEKLDSILSDIDMRARVELAKLGVFAF